MNLLWDLYWPVLTLAVVAGVNVGAIAFRKRAPNQFRKINWRRRRVLVLAGVTAGTLYQRAYCPLVDLRTAALVQFVVTLAVFAPLAWAVEGAPVRWSWPLVGAIVFLVIGASILGVNALHMLMRRGQAARVASLIYLTPLFPVAIELAMFGIVPRGLSAVGIGVTLLGVGLVGWRPRR